MSENKIAKIPVASHGIHRHRYNYPWLSSINFGDVMPCYINTVRKGECDMPKGGVYSQLMPIAHNAFATGRYNFKGIFVPYKLVWRKWYAFDQQVQYLTNGVSSIPGTYPFIPDNVFSDALIKKFGTADGTASDYDVLSVSYDSQNTPIQGFFHFSDAGRRVLRIIGALGCMPLFDMDYTDTLNILPLMCYIKAFADYYYPNNYVGNSSYVKLGKFFDTDVIDFTSDAQALCEALEICSLNFYENSVFDLAWDNPVSPNVSGVTPSVEINDITNNAALGNGSSTAQVVTNDASEANSPSTGTHKPSNGTPFVGGKASGTSSASGVLTKYVIDSLSALSNWMKRRQLSGARLIDKFLVSRGISLPNDSARISYLLGQRNIEISVSGVENNTDTNLGELAGRGIASSGDSPLNFECRPEDDGIFLIVVSPIPDANFPILRDGFAIRKDFMDNYTAEYDKLGCAAVDKSIIQSSLDGYANHSLLHDQHPFGFLSQYWDEIQERPRLLGDFILRARGAEELRAYHTFRILNPATTRYHSFDFIRMADNEQYQRLFYSSEQENLMLFIRWFGDQYKEKLPLGDSFEWDDDEFNRKVSVVIGGSQK